jgi:hypothetical protein
MEKKIFQKKNISEQQYPTKYKKYDWSQIDYPFKHAREECSHTELTYWHRLNWYWMSLLFVWHIISYHIISYHIISYHIISYHIILYHFSCLYEIVYCLLLCQILMMRRHFRERTVSIDWIQSNRLNIWLLFFSINFILIEILENRLI